MTVIPAEHKIPLAVLDVTITVNLAKVVS